MSETTDSPTTGFEIAGAYDGPAVEIVPHDWKTNQSELLEEMGMLFVVTAQQTPDYAVDAWHDNGVFTSPAVAQVSFNRALADLTDAVMGGDGDAIYGYSPDLAKVIELLQVITEVLQPKRLWTDRSLWHLEETADGQMAPMSPNDTIRVIRAMACYGNKWSTIHAEVEELEGLIGTSLGRCWWWNINRHLDIETAIVRPDEARNPVIDWSPYAPKLFNEAEVFENLGTEPHLHWSRDQRRILGIHGCMPYRVMMMVLIVALEHERAIATDATAVACGFDIPWALFSGHIPDELRQEVAQYSALINDNR